MTPSSQVAWSYDADTDCWVAKDGHLELFRVAHSFLARCKESRGLEETRTAARDGRVDFVAELREGAVWIKRIVNPTCNECGAKVGPMVAKWMGAPP